MAGPPRRRQAHSGYVQSRQSSAFSSDGATDDRRGAGKRFATSTCRKSDLISLDAALARSGSASLQKAQKEAKRPPVKKFLQEKSRLERVSSGIRPASKAVNTCLTGL